MTKKPNAEMAEKLTKVSPAPIDTDVRTKIQFVFWTTAIVGIIIGACGIIQYLIGG